jgi:alpha-tubulin suppressor-like RCC1 family protein
MLDRRRAATSLVAFIGLWLGVSACGGGDITVKDPPTVSSVNVTPTTTTVEVGKTVALTAGVIVQNDAPTTVTWASSDVTKATVTASGNDATVTGVAVGTVTITATSTHDNSKKGSSEISIVPPPPPPSIAIALSRAAVTVDAGSAAPATTVTITRNATFAGGAVDLTVEGQPLAVTASVTPNRLEGTATTATLAITATAAAVAGTTNITVRGRGDGVSDVTATIAVTVQRSDPLLASVTTGDGHTCALSTGGQAYCWGANGNGQLGDASTTSRRSPRAVAGGRVFSAVSAGYLHTCGIEKDTGAAYCWGVNAVGQLGTAAAGDKSSPTIVAGNRTYISISAGRDFSCAVATAGQAYCWGSNTTGQLGDGTTQPKTQPALVSGNLTFKSISAGIGFACGVLTNGAAYCWGRNGNGQLGDNTTQPRTVPTAVVDGRQFAQVAAGTTHTCGATPGGGGYCWGGNGAGSLGDGTTTDRLRPTALPTDRAVFTSVATGEEHSCATSTGGQAYCWGLNNLGQVGDNTIGTNRNRPTALDGGRSFSVVAAGNGHSCGVTTQAEVYCWGANVNGQIGDGTLTDRIAPVLVSFAGAAVASRD